MGLGPLVKMLFRGSQFKSLEGIAIGGSAGLRRIFTLLNSPTASEIEMGLTSIPQAFHIASVNIKTQVNLKLHNNSAEILSRL